MNNEGMSDFAEILTGYSDLSPAATRWDTTPIRRPCSDG